MKSMISYQYDYSGPIGATDSGAMSASDSGANGATPNRGN